MKMLSMADFANEMNTVPRKLYVVVSDSGRLLDNFLSLPKLPVHAYSTIAEAFGQYFTGPVVRVVCDDTNIDMEQVDNIKKGTPDDVMILWYKELSAKHPIRKAFADVIVELVANDASQENYVKRELPETPKPFLKTLVGICGNYDRLTIEVEKIKTVQKAFNCTTKEAILKLERSSNLQQYTEDTPQQLVEYIFEGKFESFFIELDAIKRKQQYGYAISILDTLYNFARKVFLIRCCDIYGADATKVTSLTKGQKYYYGKFTKKYTLTELKRLMEIVYLYRSGFTRGEYTEDIVIELAITEFVGEL